MCISKDVLEQLLDKYDDIKQHWMKMAEMRRMEIVADLLYK